MNGENSTSYISDIINIIKKSKKYSNECFTFTPYVIIYSIDDRKYKIEIDIFSNKFFFRYISYYHDISRIEVSLPKKGITERKVINAFGKIIKYLDKLNYILNKQIEISKKIENLIALYFKKEYNTDINSGNVFNFKFPSSYKKGKTKSTRFDVITEDPNNINYLIFAVIGCNDTSFEFSFTYYNNQLKLERKVERYKLLDISRIIRGEKLRKLETL